MPFVEVLTRGDGGTVSHLKSHFFRKEGHSLWCHPAALGPARPTADLTHTTSTALLLSSKQFASSCDHAHISNNAALGISCSEKLSFTKNKA